MIDNKKYFNILCKSFLWLFTLFLICIIGITRASASTFTEVGEITGKTTFLYENNQAQAMVSLPNITSTNQTLYNILVIQVNNQSISSQYVYKLELSLPLATLKNINNIYMVGGNNNNTVCQVYGMDNSNPAFPLIYFKCPTNISYFTIGLNNDSPTTNTQPITTGSNFMWSYTKLYYTNEDDIDFGPIISNQTNNTNNIINNQNQNTQDIINNQNSIAEQQEELQEVCNIIDKGSIVNINKKIDANGSLVSSNSYGVTDYVKLGKSLTRVASAGGTSAYFCWYDSSKTLLSCQTLASINTSTITPPTDAVYFRTSIEVSVNKPQFKVCYNGNQATSNAINDLNDSLNNDDSSGATSEASDFFSSFSTNTFGLTSIITAPLNLINSVLSSNCSNLELPLPYLDNKKLILPCMSSIYSQYFGTFFTIYQTITYGIIAYWVCVRIFNQVKDFKNPEHDEIEVMDL